MATIDEIRDITFYIIRKLNDIIINFTREEQPPPRRVMENPLPNDLTIEERIERIKRTLNREEPPPPPSPSPQEMIGEFIKQDEERIIDLQKQAHEKRIILNYLLDELIQRRERKEDAIVI